MAHMGSEFFVIGQGFVGTSAFEDWLKEQGIVDTPETHDANWAAFIAAITGPAGADGADGADGVDGLDGADGDNAFVTWCKQEGKDPTDADSWDEYMEAITGPKGDPGPAGEDGPAGDNAFITWCKEENIDPEDPDAWDLYIDAITGPKGEDGADGQPGQPGQPGADGTIGKDGLSPYEEFKLKHPEASYEDWLRVVTAAFSVPLVDAFVDGPAVKIPKVHPVTKKPIYRVRRNLGYLTQWLSGNTYNTVIPLTTDHIPDLAGCDSVWIDHNESWIWEPIDQSRHSVQYGWPGSLNTVSSIVYVNMHTAIAPFAITVAATSNLWARELTLCFEYTLASDEPIEFPIWTQKEGWISPPGYVGEIVATFDSEPEPGTLICDGSLLERVYYPTLYDFIQLKLPSLIIDEDTFYIPDLRGEFLRGLGTGRVMGDSQDDALQNITGQVRAWTLPSDQVNASGALTITAGETTGWTGTNAQVKTAAFIGLDASRVVRTADETRPMNTSVNFCIRYMNTFDPSGGGNMPIGSVEVIEDEVILPPPDKAFPPMTSFNTPTPYVITGSYLSNSVTQGWYPFTWGAYGAADVNDGPPHWWQLDMGEATEVMRARVVVTPASGFTLNIILSASNDNVNFDTLATSPTARGQRVVDVTFEPVKSYRYWRISVTEGTSWVHLNSVQLWKPYDV